MSSEAVRPPGYLTAHRLPGVTPRSLIALLPSTALALLAAAPAPAAASEVRKTKLADGIWQFTIAADGYVEQLNSVVVVNDRDVLVYDTGTRPSDARIILGEIRKLTSKPVRYLVNSHWHPDHWSGNQVYVAAFPDLDIIATEEALLHMRHAAPAWPAIFKRNLERARAELDQAIRTGKQADGTPLTAEKRRKDEAELRLYADFVAEARTVRRTFPTLTYVDRMTLRHGGREMRLLSLAGDARGTTVLYLPREKIVMTGDVVVHPVPYSTPAPGERIRDLKALRELDYAILVPGHGPAMRDNRYVDLVIQLLESVTRQVRAALQRGAATLDEVGKAVDVRALRRKFARGDRDLESRFDHHVSNNLIPQAIREAREQDYRQ
jgi:cyclase